MIEQADVLRLFRVDLDAGRLFWRSPPWNHPRLRDQEAGRAITGRRGKSYWVVKIERRAHKRGRLIYLAAHGRLPHPCIDHINGDSLDDRLVNLREASVAENARNHKRRARRIALPMGVRASTGGRFEARIGFDGRQIHLGAYETPEAAHAVYLQKRKELFGEFA